MISIISSKRYKELLEKERAADEITAMTRFGAEFTAISGVEPAYELNQATILVTNALRICEPGSPVFAMLQNARFHIARLYRCVAPEPLA